MSKVLYVRGFNDKLHEELDDQARKEGISAASILETAFEEWLKNKQSVQTKHFLVLYSDDQSLQNFMKKINDLNDGDWFHVTCGPESHAGVKYLKKHGWYDVTLSPYAQGIKNPEKYSSKIFDHLAKVTANKQACFIGFMTEDIAHHHSIQKASEVEKKYNTKRIGGVVFCPYDMRKLNNFNFLDMFKLFEDHDQIFVLKENEVHEVNIGKTNCAKLFL
jgi:hypothetical protein